MSESSRTMSASKCEGRKESNLSQNLPGYQKVLYLKKPATLGIRVKGFYDPFTQAREMWGVKKTNFWTPCSTLETILGSVSDTKKPRVSSWDIIVFWPLDTYGDYRLGDFRILLRCLDPVFMISFWCLRDS